MLYIVLAILGLMAFSGVAGAVIVLFLQWLRDVDNRRPQPPPYDPNWPPPHETLPDAPKRYDEE